MANAGMAITLFGIFIFYSFLGWGIAELYNEKFIPMDARDFVNFGENNTDSSCAEYVGTSGEASCGWWEEHVSSIWIFNSLSFVAQTVDNLKASVSVMTYADPHIPYLVNLFIITPMNFLVIAFGILIIRGIGS